VEFLNSIGVHLNDEYLPKLVNAAVVLILGYVLGKLLSLTAMFIARRYTGAQGVMIARRVGFWLIMGAAIASAMSQLGFEVGALLGAAGILTVALGFASQTSASNLISGLFLIGERPFVVGDIIKVGNTTGEVLSIDMLSVKLRTFDNLFVRVPNESLIKSEITNLTRFPLRRIDLTLGVAYKENMARVREVLMRVAEQDPQCLAEPAPLFIFLGIGDSSLDFQFSVWTLRENFLEVKNRLLASIKNTFDEQGIEIPYPQRDLHLIVPESDVAARVTAAATGTR
jgi:small-conductance mechanosensitive channel